MREGAPITSQGPLRLYSFSFEFRPLFSYCHSLLRHAASVFAPYPFPFHPSPPPCIKYGNNAWFHWLGVWWCLGGCHSQGCHGYTLYSVHLPLRHFSPHSSSLIILSIVSRGGWLGNLANIKVENSGAVGYVGSSLTVHNPLFSVHKLWLNKLMQFFY